MRRTSRDAYALSTGSACMSHAYIHREKPKRVWPPRYPAWPELADPSTYYTLPTVASHPAIRNCKYSRKWFLSAREGDPARELIYVMFPDCAEELLAKLPLTTEDIFGMAVESLDLHAMSRGLARACAVLGIADPEWSVFAIDHELGHSISFELSRPTILEVNRIASGIFELFKKLSVTSLTECENFWNEFQKGNGTLVRYLDNALILEEVRANLYAFSALDPMIRVSIEPDLRKVMAEDDTISLFDKLADVSNEDWEVYDYSSAMKLKEAYKRKDEPSWRVGLEEPMYRTPEIVFTPLNEYEVSAVHHLSLSDVRELVFLESLRQQLAQVSGLVCPFQQGRRTCCGFGHYLRAVCEHLPPEYRYPRFVLHPKTGEKQFFKAPPKFCSNYVLG